MEHGAVGGPGKLVCLVTGDRKLQPQAAAGGGCLKDTALLRFTEEHFLRNGPLIAVSYTHLDVYKRQP